MGYGVAAPIALSLANDRAQVLSVIGDGGLMMYPGELETAARLGVPVRYVVLVDGSLALIEVRSGSEITRCTECDLMRQRLNT
jgi:acetolactate synthase-1/2/3 large subunit